MKKFLVVVDTQYDFMMPDGALYVPSAEEIIVPGIKFLANLDPEEYEGVLFTFDTHEHDSWETFEESKTFPIHCVKGTNGWMNVFNPAIIHSDISICSLEKNVFSMWEEPLIDLVCVVTKDNIDPNPITNVYPNPGSIAKITYDRDGFFDHIQRMGIDIIEVMGVASDYCVKWAVDGLVKRGFPVVVKDELCRGIGATAKETFDTAEYIGNVAVR
jgi:nicotinamidase/pyrazinamidase